MSIGQQERPVVLSVPTDKGQVVASFESGDFAVPTGREEDWRFTPLRRVKDLFTLSSAPTAGMTVDAPSEVVVEKVDRSDARIGAVLTPIDRASAIAWETLTSATVVTVPADLTVDSPILVTLTGDDTSSTHLRVVAESFSRSTVVVDCGGGGRNVTNFEVSVGDGAELTFIVATNWDRDAVQLGRVHTQVGRDARLRQILGTFGGDTVRLVSTVDYAGPGGEAELLGAYFCDAGQHLEHRLFVDHESPHCRSNVVYKGALQGEHAHTVWIGDVLIRAAAVGTETYEVNRNLVLSEGARADSVPNLEIETGEVVGAGHASTTGRFDDEQLFYLQARGIDEGTARRLVVHGFFADVINSIPVESVRNRLWDVIEAEVRIGEDGGAS